MGPDMLVELESLQEWRELDGFRTRAKNREKFHDSSPLFRGR
jgi:hypothetical protein